MSTTLPEPWLRGPVPGVPGLLQPAAHALLMSLEDCEQAATDLTADELWTSPGGAASVGYHLRHLVGSTDRLLTYARGEALDDVQKAALLAEARPASPAPTAAQMVAAWRVAVASAMGQLSATSESALGDSRTVGKAQLPSTVIGLLFHAAEHASRHTGQVVTTAKIVRASRA